MICHSDFFLESESSSRGNFDPSVSKMHNRMTRGWKSSKDDTSDRHQTKLRNQTSSDQIKPCKRSASEFEQKSRRGKLPGLLFCYGQFAVLLLLLQAVTKVLSIKVLSCFDSVVKMCLSDALHCHQTSKYVCTWKSQVLGDLGSKIQ